MLALDRIPNKHSLGAGAVATILFAGYMVRQVEYSLLLAFIVILLGIPVAFVFLMFNNPKEQKDLNWGTVIAMPICSMMWPIVLFALLIGRPWNSPQGKNRDQSESTSPESQSPESNRESPTE